MIQILANQIDMTMVKLMTTMPMNLKKKLLIYVYLTISVDSKLYIPFQGLIEIKTRYGDISNTLLAINRYNSFFKCHL